VTNSEGRHVRTKERIFMSVISSFPKRSIKFARTDGQWFSFVALGLVMLGAIGVYEAWGAAMLVNRTLTQAFLTGGALCFLLGGVAGQISCISIKCKHRALRHNFPVVATCDLESQPMRGPRERLLRFTWTDPQTHLACKDSTIFSWVVEPFWLNRGRTKILAVASSSGRGDALDWNLNEIVLTDDERAVIFLARSQAND
jgi:hypothetical protein